jgi:DNA transformation protein and related proteins
MQKLKNLGPVSWAALEKVGITDTDTLRDVGALQAYLAVRKAEDGTSLNFLYAMVAGLRDCHWTDVSAEEKGRLLRELDDLMETF